MSLSAVALVCVASVAVSGRAEPRAPHDADAGVLVPVVEVLAPEVDGEGAALPPPGSLEAADPSASATVIERKDHPGEAVDAAELVLAAPGVTVQDSGGVGQRKTLSLRGAAPNATLVMLDGVPLSGPGEAFDLSRLPAALIERLEVLRGADTARFGPGAMGGVVNVVTRAPQGTSLFGQASQGSFGTTRGLVGGSTSLAGGDALLLVHGLKSDGDYDYVYQPGVGSGDVAPQTLQRRNNQSFQGGGLVRYRRQLGSVALDVLGEGSGERRGLAGTVQNPTPDAGQTQGRGTLSTRLTRSLDGGGEVTALLSGRLDGTTLTGSPFATGTYRQLERALGGDVTVTKLLGRHGLTGLLGAGYTDLDEPSGKHPAQGRFSAMAADEVFFFDGRLTLSGAARLDVVGPFVLASPRVGAALALPRGFYLKANGGQASRAPSFAEAYVLQGTLLPNPDLKPERSLSADGAVGFKHAKGQLELTGFGALTENLISYEYYPPSLAKAYNFQAASVAGVEVEGRVQPLPWLSAQASYTFLSTHNLKDDPRYYEKALPFRPAHRLQARVTAGVPLFRGWAEVLFQSAQFTNRTETLALPARSFVNVGVVSQVWRRPELTVGLELKNALDTHAQDVDGYPLPPRSLSFTLALAWDQVS
jgi:iron complex outermembrane receptor protein